GCGNPSRSDLDLLVVTRRALTAKERDAFGDLPAGSYEKPGWPRPLELSALTLEQLRPWRHPAPYDLHLATPRIVGPGEDPDLAAHVTVTRRAGIALAGPPPAAVFPEVPRADYEDALLRDFDASWWPADAKHMRYAVLSLPRIWATLAEPDRLHTKETAAVWALGRLPADLRRPLELALESYRAHGRDLDVDPDEFRRYADHIVAEVGR
ncbi:MAG TPA: aminoglycoside adenylyltransferase domain-containing protein, partial [Gaiellaceae bacterium]